MRKKAKTANDGPTGEVIRFQGVDVYVRATGAGPPVLLINGLGTHTAMWEPMEASLDGFRILQFDLPGSGQSATPSTLMPIPELARLSTVVMDHYGVKRAHVIGYSMGGLVAQQLAHDAPERVQRMVLLASTAGRGSFRGSILATINMLAPVRYLSPRIYDMTAGSLVGGRARHDTAWVADQGLLRRKHPPTWRGYLSQLRSILRWSGFPILGEVSHEVLVLAGDDDPIIPVVNAMMLTHMLPNGRLLVIRGEGHMMMMDPDSRTHPAIREFLSATDLDTTQIWQDASAVDADELKSALAGAGVVLPWSVDARIRRRWLRKNARPGTAHTVRAEA